MALAKIAYIDESMRVPHGLYVLAAVIVADHHADHHRAELRAHLYRGQLRLHWRDESNHRRTELIAAMSLSRTPEPSSSPPAPSHAARNAPAVNASIACSPN
jgi:hypothetical protein